MLLDKTSPDEISPGQKVPLAEMSRGQSVILMKCLWTKSRGTGKREDKEFVLEISAANLTQEVPERLLELEECFTRRRREDIDIDHNNRYY